jgi:hypothetical protein
MDNCRVLGVIDHGAPEPMLLYLNREMAATPDVLALAAPLKPIEVFRLAATCEEHRCPHYDGTDCQLATRIVAMVPAAVETLPPCLIRKNCRWYSQEGEAACHRCPEITTVTYDLSPRMSEVSGVEVRTDH